MHYDSDGVTLVPQSPSKLSACETSSRITSGRRAARIPAFSVRPATNIDHVPLLSRRLCPAGKDEAGTPSGAQRNHAHLMHSHLVEFLRDYLRRPELQVIPDH